MIGPKEAVKNATSFLLDLFPEARDVRLEEVEPKEQQWSIVLSFKSEEPSTLASVMGGSRLFKDIKVDSESGTPQSLKIWKFQ